MLQPGEIPATALYQGDEGHEAIDVVDIALIFAGISAAAEVFAQYQSWRESRERIQPASDGRTLAQMRRTLLRVGDRADSAAARMDQLTSQLAEALSLIEAEDRELLYQISFLKGYKGRVRWSDRGRYKDLVASVQWLLSDLLRILDEIAELVAELVPPQTNEEMLQEARASAAEHKAITDVLYALSDADTTFGQATDLVMALLEATRPYLDSLREEAFGDAENLNPRPR